MTAMATPRGHLQDVLRTLGHDVVRLEALPGDVSLRRYVRVHLRGGQKVMAALYPDELRRAQACFLESTRLLLEQAVRVPRVLGNRFDAGVTVVEDLGDDQLFDRESLSLNEADLTTCVNLALRISSCPIDAVRDLNPPLDATLFQRELDQTWTVALEPSGLSRTSEGGRALDEALASLCTRLGEEPTQACHRDLMVRNLLRVGGELAVIDHQDLRPGPVGYDLASLASDSVQLPPERREEVRAASGLDAEPWDRLVAQRMWKIVGTFFAFAERGSPRHLRLVPGSIDLGVEALLRLPEGQALPSRLDIDAMRTAITDRAHAWPSDAEPLV